MLRYVWSSKQQAEAITSFSAGDHTTEAVLGPATGSVSAGTVTLAKAAGVTFPSMLATELAITKGESFFDALEAAAGNIPGKAEAALADLRSAGALPVRQGASPLTIHSRYSGDRLPCVSPKRAPVPETWRR